MAVSTQEPSQENSTDRYPLLMELKESNENQAHFVDIERGCDASSSSLSHNGSPHRSTLPQHDDGLPSSGRIPIAQSPSSSSHGSESSSSPTARRGEGSGRRHWSPFNNVLWLSIELVFTMGQIISAIVVLSVSRHEKSHTPLFAWILGYAIGCAASFPILYWRYLHCNWGTEQASTQMHQDSSQGNTTSERNSYITISLARTTEEENGQNTSSGTWSSRIMGAPNIRLRLSILMDQLKMALDCFFAVWFVVGNVWIFGGHSSSADAPNLYRLCIVFLTFSCIGYAMPFILCSMICCCLPCIISILGIRDDMNGMRGATEETINALPTHKFKSKEKGNDSSGDSNSVIDEGGFVAAGTEKECVISGEDAVCCICLSRYANDDELRELPCSHFFHTECVDKWLKINACCPLCKFEIGNSNENSPSAADSN
ncbi:E3 ubiquitin-protein ligase At1g63170-like isoform X1 [Actinidia eriantha]|uniref:E3 ubiquitin-protein ligase At1g63170-like isoform X1 n=1 Tax=Actinidia eriantha TaxID=165200 RepID=UPI002590039E|nr:E3 ubiquitin-protein ligase At1g63170-like isoform X1 [Actinidia eriantha]XP_057494312.1 E3 ubiquitin-protein ligase At1g63170-like isoform X1 [Actinidia eriantha]